MGIVINDAAAGAAALKKITDASRNIVFFGGAGISTESGIPDFRSKDGLYNQKYDYPPETIISHTFYKKNPEEFFRFYKDRMIYSEAKPNSAHIALARLEKEGKLSAVITQNIDGLHSLAGSREVCEIHGCVNRNYCEKCRKAYTAEQILNMPGIPRCDCGGIIKPDVVLYEESLDSALIEKSIVAIEKADTLIIGGTSLSVYPAASFVNYFSGENLVIINRDPTPRDEYADLVIHAKAGEVFSKI